MVCLLSLSWTSIRMWVPFGGFYRQDTGTHSCSLVCPQEWPWWRWLAWSGWAPSDGHLQSYRSERKKKKKRVCVEEERGEVRREGKVCWWKEDDKPVKHRQRTFHRAEVWWKLRFLTLYSPPRLHLMTFVGGKENGCSTNLGWLKQC